MIGIGIRRPRRNPIAFDDGCCQPQRKSRRSWIFAAQMLISDSGMIFENRLIEVIVYFIVPFIAISTGDDQIN